MGGSQAQPQPRSRGLRACTMGEGGGGDGDPPESLQNGSGREVNTPETGLYQSCYSQSNVTRAGISFRKV